MKEVFQAVEAMQRDGVIQDYAVAGAVGAIFYVEPFFTMDVDFLVNLPVSGPLVRLDPIHEWLRRHGYRMNEEGLFEVAGRPIQFLPADKDALTAEAFREANYLSFENALVRVVRPEYLAAEAIQLGRPKDVERVSSLFSAKNFDAKLLENLIRRFSLENNMKRIEEFLK